MPNAIDRLLRNRGGIGLFALLALDLFAIIVVVMAAITTIGFITVLHGTISVDFWRDPALLTGLLALVCVVLTFAVCCIVRGVILKPLADMLRAMDQLKCGNFDVRAENRSPMRIRELDQFVESFNATARALGQTEVLRRNFINDFSHEFKTPIVSINGFAELLRDPNLSNEERQQYARIIAKESKRLVNLSSDILALQQTEALDRLPQTSIEPVRIDEQLRQAVLLMQEKWSSKGLSFNVELAEASIEGHAGFLAQMWNNLLDNACKFSPEGGFIDVELVVEKPGTAAERATRPGKRAAVEAAQSPSRGIRVRVANNGPEISPDQLERIFDRFYQADASHATQGCGLGLPLVRRVAQLHGGKVSAESERGHTTFEVRL